LASALAFSRRLFVNGKARANFHVGLDKTAQLHRRHRNWPFYCVTRHGGEGPSCCPGSLISKAATTSRRAE